MQHNTFATTSALTSFPPVSFFDQDECIVRITYNVAAEGEGSMRHHVVLVVPL